MQCNLCVNDIIVEKPLHRDDPTLSALEASIQWHENIVTSGDFFGCSGWPDLSLCCIVYTILLLERATPENTKKATKYGVKILNGTFTEMKKYFMPSNYIFEINIETFIQNSGVYKTSMFV